MQITALNTENELVNASQAVKQQDYSCLECRKTVRLREGPQRQAHFYHLKPNQECRQHAKGIEHIMIQHLFRSWLNDEVILEYRFPEIGRIADVAWPSKRLIFEIQFSSISPEEVLARNTDYTSLGYQVVWILHDQRYNKTHPTAVEEFLRTAPHYFTNIDATGSGIIYDQLKIRHCGKSLFRSAKLPIDVRAPIFSDRVKVSLKESTANIFHKRAHWPLGFFGDCMDRYRVSFGDESFQKEIETFLQQRQLANPAFKFTKYLSLNRLRLIYRSIFRLFLENSCK